MTNSQKVTRHGSNLLQLSEMHRCFLVRSNLLKYTFGQTWRERAGGKGKVASTRIQTRHLSTHQYILSCANCGWDLRITQSVELSDSEPLS